MDFHKGVLPMISIILFTEKYNVHLGLKCVTFCNQKNRNFPYIQRILSEIKYANFYIKKDMVHPDHAFFPLLYCLASAPRGAAFLIIFYGYDYVRT